MKQTIQKMVALGVGLTMVGATIFGASAYTLADWPAPFVVNGVPAANYAIAVGDNAAGSDVIGAIDINSALQQAAVVKTTVTAPAVSGVVLTGDAAEVGSTSDLLEINETIGNVRETFTEVDLDMLKGGQIVTDEGSTEYNQYLRFNKTQEVSASGGRTSGSVVFYSDERDKVGHYLYWEDGVQLFEWELEFEEGLQSEIDGVTNTRDLKDLEDEDIFILGQPFVIVDTDLWLNNQTLKLSLMGGATGGILGENDKETYVIDGKEYEVEVVVISETSQGGEGSVKFRINGEITDELTDGETDVLADGTQIGIRDILATGKDIQKSIVQFYIGAYKISFLDMNTSDTIFDSSGTKVNEESIEDSEVQIRGQLLNTNTDFEVTSIKYRLYADSVLGSTYIPPGTGMREQLDEPEGMLTPFWDIRYEGLMDTGVTIIRFDAAGDDKYNLEFTNQEGIMYDMPLMSNENSVTLNDHFLFGDEDDDLYFQEAVQPLYPIADDDFFILSDCGVDLTGTMHHGNPATTDDNTCFTHVLRYDSIDTANRQLKFTDLGTGTREVTYDSSTNMGSLIVGGVTYLVNRSGNNLNIDLNGDGFMRNCNDSVIAVQGEGLIAFDGWQCVNNTNVTNYRAIPVASCAEAVSNCSTHLNNFTFNVATLQKEFDEANGDELVNVTVIARTGAEIGIPSNNVIAGNAFTIFFGLYDLEENEDLSQAMSGYGLFFEMYDPHSGTQAEDLTIEYPLSQRGARVFVTGGQVNVQEISTGGVSEQLQPIQLGAAKLASEIANITQFNAIVVGGPCANPLAAQLMGNPEPCWESIPENKAIVKLFTHANGNVALLVAGRTAMNTRQAARAVATGQIKSVAAAEAEISGTSLTDVKVQAV